MCSYNYSAYINLDIPGSRVSYWHVNLNLLTFVYGKVECSAWKIIFFCKTKNGCDVNPELLRPLNNITYRS